MRVARTTAFVLAVTFAAVGVAFLLAPGAIATLFRWIGEATGTRSMPAGDVESGLFRALAVAYMYVVTLFAWMMYRRPAELVWWALLAQAKLASAAVSFLLFAFHGPYLIYAANGVADGLIGVMVLLLRRHVNTVSGVAAEHDR